MTAFPDRFREATARAIQPPADIPIAAWVERHRVLPRGSAFEGPKRVDLTPALRPIYDWFRDPHIREIVVVKSAQIGYTDALVDLILWIAVNDPAPTAFYLADQATAKKMMTARIRPAIAELGLLRKRTDNRKQDATSYEVSLTNGFHLVVSWASSIAGTASMSFKYLFLDEVDKPGYLANRSEGGAIGRIRERAETYPDRKIVIGSTPTLESGLIHREMQRVDATYDWCVPCPACGVYQPLRWSPTKTTAGDSGSVAWDGGGKATRRQAEETARYQCGSCRGTWTTLQKNEAVVLGKAMPRAEPPANTRRVGLHLNRILSLFPGGRFETLVWDWLSKQSDHAELQNFVNSSLGEPWIEVVSDLPTREATLRACVIDIPPRVVPSEAIALVAGIDTQQHGFWYRVRAYAKDMTSWGIDEGYCAGWDELERLLYDMRYPAEGRPGEFRIWRALIDTGGTIHEGNAMSRTEEVYHWIIQNRMREGPKVFPAKGASHPLQAMVKLGEPLERLPGSEKTIRQHGLRLALIDTDQGKSGFWFRAGLAQEQKPGAAYLHRDTQPDYFKQILAEEQRRQRDGSIEWVRIRPDNHFLDCEVLCRAAVDGNLLGGLLPYRKPAAPPQQAQQHKQTTSQRQDEDDWWTRGTSGGIR